MAAPGILPVQSVGWPLSLVLDLRAGNRRMMLRLEMQRYETRSGLAHFFFERSPKRERWLRRDIMKKLILTSVSALALLGVAACSDSGTDKTTTQSTNPPAAEQPMKPAAPATDTTKPAEPAPAAPAAPAQ